MVAFERQQIEIIAFKRVHKKFLFELFEAYDKLMNLFSDENRNKVVYTEVD